MVLLTYNASHPDGSMTSTEQPQSLVDLDHVMQVLKPSSALAELIRQVIACL